MAKPEDAFKVMTDLYQDNAEARFQQGLSVTGHRDQTFAVKEELKAMGCLWHATRNRWVAADPSMKAEALALVKRGPTPGFVPPNHKKQFQYRPLSPNSSSIASSNLEKFAQQMAGKNGQAAIDQLEAHLAAVRQPPPPAPPEPDSLLVALEERGVIELPPGRVTRALLGEPLNEEEFALAFAKTDEAFEV